MNEKVGFIGLGNLGQPVAANLLQAGYPLRVFNRTASKAEPLAAMGAELAATPADAVPPQGVVISLLWDDASLESVVASEGFLKRLGAGGIHLSMTTVTPACAKGVAGVHETHGSTYVEAPIFGRPEAAAARALWLPLAGPRDAKERVRPLLAAMGAQGVFDFGEEIGAATLVKLIGNFLIVSAGRSMQEALAVARHHGVDPKAVVAMLTSTLFAGSIYEGYGKRIAEQGLAFGRNPIPGKDVGLLRMTARSASLPTPIADLLSTLLAEAGRPE